MTEAATSELDGKVLQGNCVFNVDPRPAAMQLEATDADAFDQCADVLECALMIRLVEERLLRLFGEGKIFGTIHTCIGQEFVGVSVARALQPHDAIFSNHRCHGHFLSYRRNLRGLIGEVMGKSVGVCGGRGGSQHLHLENFFSNGVQGGIVPVAAGFAWGQKTRADNGITVVFLGDGTLGQGAVYESMNLASKWDLPVLFVCENNFYAQSTAQEQTLAGSITARAEAFGIETAHSDTWRWEDLLAEMARSVDLVRSLCRPRFHLVDTYRLMAHSKGDDPRPAEVVASYRERDPLTQLMTRHQSDGRFLAMRAGLTEAVERAVQEAEQAPFASIELPSDPCTARVETWEPLRFDKERIVDSVRRGLAEGLQARRDILLIGEDIESPYGGDFKCTAGLSSLFPGRVRNSPISEAALVGVGNGLALSGCIPVVEIMFGDFLTLAADQWINHASKFRWMYNDTVRVPLIVRTPMGGKRGYGPTHSQSIEKHFIGLPGTIVLCLHHRYSPARLYKDLFETVDCPVLVLENKLLYGQYVRSDCPPGFRLVATGENFPIVRLQPDLPADVTVLSIGGMSPDAERAVSTLFEEDEILVDLFLPTQLYPFDVGFLESSLRVTGKLLVVEEGQKFVSMSSEVLAQVVERFAHLSPKCRRLAATPTPIPTARPLEDRCLPSADAIVRAVRELAR